MADIELVIKIPEEAYKQITEFGFLEKTHGKICYKAIKNGTPISDNTTFIAVLDKIISEATSLKISYTDHDKDTYRRGVNDVLKIIDKYQAESEE